MKLKINISISFVFFFTLIHCQFAREIRISELQVTCQANCLKQYKDNASKDDLSFLELQPTMIETHCLKNSQLCNYCWNACEMHPQITPHYNCSMPCQNSPIEESCVNSCEFMRQLLEGNKCSRSVCQETTGLPQVPVAPRIMQQKNKLYELDFPTYNPTSTRDPIIILIQVRVSTGSQQYDVTSFSRWIDLVKTSKRVLELHDLKVNRIYQFRLAAFNYLGFIGYSRASSPLKLQPPPPAPVTSIREGSVRLEGGQISVKILWALTVEKNSQLKKYSVPDKFRITWQRYYDLPGTSESSVVTYSAILPGDQGSYVIENLLPSANYFIQVTSLASLLGNKYLKSQPASLYVRTLNLPNDTTRYGNYKSKNSESLPYGYCPCNQQRRKLLPIFKLESPILDYETLKMGFRWRDEDTEAYLVHLQWYPHTCIETELNRNILRANRQRTVNSGRVNTQDKTFQLEGLMFNCIYTLNVTALSPKKISQKSRWSVCFCTPSCWDTVVLNGDKPSCPQGQPIPERPRNLRYLIEYPDNWTDKSDNQSVAVVMKWDPPREEFSISGYRITWAPRMDEPVSDESYSLGLSPTMDKTKAQSKVLRGTASRLKLANFYPGQLYIVQIQTITSLGDSPVLQIHFKIPNSSETTTQYPSSGSFLNCQPPLAFLIVSFLTRYFCL